MLVLFFRVMILYFLILVSLRLMGKREVGQLQPFDLVVNIMIADLASQPLSDVNIPLMAGILPVIVILFLQLLMSYLCVRSKRIRRIICGESVILVKNGRFNQKYMKNMLITVDDLTEMLRGCGLKDINDLDTLIIDTNGKASVTEKKDKGLITTLIEYGEMNEDKISGLFLSKTDVIREMKKSGIYDVKEVFWGFYFDKKMYFLRKENE